MSVIIPALDAESTIERCVNSILKQDLPALDVIVVDNGSRDRTGEIAARAGARVVVEPLRGRSRARNRGAAEARGSRLAFIDSDCEAPSDWLSCSSAALREPWLSAVQARVQKSSASPPGRRFVQVHYYWPFLDTCALVTTRAAYDAAGGFDEELTRNEDMDFSFRLLACGFGFAWMPDTIVRKEHRLNAAQALTRGWVGGQSLAILSAKWRTHMGVSRTRFWRDLSKNIVKSALREARNPRASHGAESLEAMGRLFGCVQTDIAVRGIQSTLRAPATSLSKRLGERRFPVFGPDETLLYDASEKRILRLNLAQRRHLERYIEDPSSACDAQVVHDLGLGSPGSSR